MRSSASRHALAFLVLGVLFVLLSGAVGVRRVGVLTVDLSDLSLALAGTFLSLAVLLGFYRLFGEEDTIRLIRQLLAAFRISSNAEQIGVRQLWEARQDVPIQEIHDRVARAQRVFFAARDFGPIRYARVQRIFTDLVDAPGRSVRILLEARSPNVRRLQEFVATLGPPQRERFEIRTVEEVAKEVYATESGAYVTFCFLHLAPDEAVTVYCEPTAGPQDLYGHVCQEFERLWEAADPA